MAYTEREQQPVKILLFAFGNGVQKIVCRFVAHALQRRQLRLNQKVQVSRVADKPVIQQLVNNRRAAAIDIHCPFGSKVN